MKYAFFCFLAVAFAAAGEDWTRIYATESHALSADGATLYFRWCGTNWTASATGGIAHVCADAPKSFDAGAHSKKMDDALANQCRVSPDGRRVVCRFRGDSQFRLRRGSVSSRTGEIWMYDSAFGSWTNLVRNSYENRCPAWLGNNAFAYLRGTGRGGFDVRRFDLRTGADEILVASEADGGEPPTFMSSSADGRTLVVRRGFDLWRYRGRERSRIVLHPDKAWKGRPPVRSRWYEDGDRCSLVPVAGGNDVIFTVGGDLWAVKPGDGTNEVRRLWSGESRACAREPVVSGDGRTLYCLRDYGDRTELWATWRRDCNRPWHEDGELASRCIVSRPGRLAYLRLSPDGGSLSWVDDSARGIFICPTNEGAKAVSITPSGTFMQWEHEWSPDGRRIAVAAADKDRNIETWVVPVDNPKAAVNVSDHMMWDGEPRWTADGATLVFNGTWTDDGARRMFEVDMSKPLETGCARLVNADREKSLRKKLVARPSVKMPHVKAEQQIVMADYQELAFLAIWSRLGVRFALPRMNGVDWSAMRAKYLPAARNAPSWRQFQRVVLQMLGELDASHLDFYSTDEARKEWSLPKNSWKKSDRREPVDRVRSKVHAATSNRWGYLRIPKMNKECYNAFRNDLYREGRGREGVIIDVRGNTGGNTADLILSCLMTPPHGYSDWQGGGKGYSVDHLRRVQFGGKVVALIDEKTCSNGEMFAHALKTLKRATLVGRPTSGEVLATQEFKVLDWGEFRIPLGRWFTQDGTEMEGNGARPDVRVDDTPADWMRGADVQLERAIRLATTP